jgi:hypothetical protein
MSPYNADNRKLPQEKFGAATSCRPYAQFTTLILTGLEATVTDPRHYGGVTENLLHEFFNFTLSSSLQSYCDVL